MTTPQLLAIAHGRHRDGPHRCFFCGGPCDATRRAADHRSDTFADWASVACPASEHACEGCAIATDEADRSKRPRFFSWIVTPTGSRSFAKGDNVALREAGLSPPDGPYAVVVAVSGQKHLLYRAPVNQSRDVVTVQFELERVTYRPAGLAEALGLCGRVAAACGKPALLDAPTTRLATAIADYWVDFEPLLRRWLDAWQRPHVRLAAHLTPKMEDCRSEYPSDLVTPAAAPDVRRGRIPAQVGRADGPGLFR